MPTSSPRALNLKPSRYLQLREKGKATNAPPSHNAYTRAYFSRAILGPWGSLVYPWWFGTTRLRFKSGRTHLQFGWEPISTLPEKDFGVFAKERGGAIEAPRPAMALGRLKGFHRSGDYGVS